MSVPGTQHLSSIQKMDPIQSLFEIQNVLGSRYAPLIGCACFIFLRNYFAMDVAMSGLSGLTSIVRVLGMMIKSMSSIGIAPNST